MFDMKDMIDRENESKEIAGLLWFLAFGVIMYFGVSVGMDVFGAESSDNHVWIASSLIFLPVFLFFCVGFALTWYFAWAASLSLYFIPSIILGSLILKNNSKKLEIGDDDYDEYTGMRVAREKMEHKARTGDFVYDIDRRKRMSTDDYIKSTYDEFSYYQFYLKNCSITELSIFALVLITQLYYSPQIIDFINGSMVGRVLSKMLEPVISIGSYYINLIF